MTGNKGGKGSGDDDRVVLATQKAGITYVQEVFLTDLPALIAQFLPWYEIGWLWYPYLPAPTRIFYAVLYGLDKQFEFLLGRCTREGWLHRIPRPEFALKDKSLPLFKRLSAATGQRYDGASMLRLARATARYGSSEAMRYLIDDFVDNRYLFMEEHQSTLNSNVDARIVAWSKECNEGDDMPPDMLELGSLLGNEATKAYRLIVHKRRYYPIVADLDSLCAEIRGVWRSERLLENTAFCAVLRVRGRKLVEAELEQMIKENYYYGVLDGVNSHVFGVEPFKSMIVDAPRMATTREQMCTLLRCVHELEPSTIEAVLKEVIQQGKYTILNPWRRKIALIWDKLIREDHPHLIQKVVRGVQDYSRDMHLIIRPFIRCVSDSVAEATMRELILQGKKLFVNTAKLNKRDKALWKKVLREQ